MPISCDLSKTSRFEKRKKVQAHFVTSYCLTITYNRAGFTYKSLRNHVQEYYAFSSEYALYAPCMSTPLDSDETTY